MSSAVFQGAPRLLGGRRGFGHVGRLSGGRLNDLMNLFIFGTQNKEPKTYHKAIVCYDVHDAFCELYLLTIFYTTFFPTSLWGSCFLRWHPAASRLVRRLVRRLAPPSFDLWLPSCNEHCSNNM